MALGCQESDPRVFSPKLKLISKKDWRRLFEGVTDMFSDEDLVTIKTEPVVKDSRYAVINPQTKSKHDRCHHTSE